jgi:hypothetical protein
MKNIFKLIFVISLLTACEKESEQPKPQIPANMYGEYSVDKTCDQSHYIQTLSVTERNATSVIFTFSNGEKYNVAKESDKLTIIANGAYAGTGTFTYPDIYMEVVRYSGTGTVKCSFWAKHK